MDIMDFEDLAEYTEVEDPQEELQILLNLTYILVVLVVVATALTFVLFSAREYLIAKKNKPRSPTSARIRKDGWITDEIQVALDLPVNARTTIHTEDEKSLASPNEFHFATPQMRPGPPSTGGHLDMVTAYSDTFPSMDVIDRSLRRLIIRQFRIKSGSPISTIRSQNTRGEQNIFDIITDENAFAGPRAPFTFEVTKRFQSPKKEPPSLASTCDPISKNLSSSNYTIVQMSALKVLPLVGSIFNHNMTQRQTLLFSRIARYSSQIPVTEYESAWSAEKAITKIRACLDGPEVALDFALKRIYLLTLFSIGASYKNLDNANYFLPAFNDFIEAMLDMGRLFELLGGVGSFTQRTLMEMVVSYCWSHWDFKPQHAPDIMARFHIWNLPAPLVQTHASIFRFLCNFALGLCTVKNIDRRDLVEAEFRVHTLMKEITRCASCHDYIGILPMLSQAMELTEISRVKALFYQVLQILIANHSKCCMSDYLLEPLLDLKILVQHGLWHCNHIKVTEKAYEIYVFLKSHNSALVTSWWDEVDGGRINALPSQVPELPQNVPFAQNTESSTLPIGQSKTPASIHISTLRLRPATPGSWYIDLCMLKGLTGSRPSQSQERYHKVR